MLIEDEVVGPEVIGPVGVLVILALEDVPDGPELDVFPLELVPAEEPVTEAPDRLAVDDAVPEDEGVELLV